MGNGFGRSRPLVWDLILNQRYGINVLLSVPFDLNSSLDWGTADIPRADGESEFCDL